MLDVARIIVGVAWLVVAVGLSGSIWRIVFGPSRPHDPVWSLFWFLACHQLGYTGRWLMEWTTATHGPGGDFMSLLGLNVMSAMLAAGIIAIRTDFEGWRW